MDLITKNIQRESKFKNGFCYNEPTPFQIINRMPYINVLNSITAYPGYLVIDLGLKDYSKIMNHYNNDKFKKYYSDTHFYETHYQDDPYKTLARRFNNTINIHQDREMLLTIIEENVINYTKIKQDDDSSCSVFKHDNDISYLFFKKLIGKVIYYLQV